MCACPPRRCPRARQKRDSKKYPLARAVGCAENLVAHLDEKYVSVSAAAKLRVRRPASRCGVGVQSSAIMMRAAPWVQLIACRSKRAPGSAVRALDIREQRGMVDADACMDQTRVAVGMQARRPTTAGNRRSGAGRGCRPSAARRRQVGASAARAGANAGFQSHQTSPFMIGTACRQQGQRLRDRRRFLAEWLRRNSEPQAERALGDGSAFGRARRLMTIPEPTAASHVRRD